MSGNLCVCSVESGGIDPLHKWHLNLNNNTWYILSLTFMFQDRNFHMNVRLRMYEYCYSNLDAIYAKDLWWRRL